MKYSHKQILLGLIQDKIRDLKENTHLYQLQDPNYIKSQIETLEELEKELEEK